jgi:hypothetical protein
MPLSSSLKPEDHAMRTEQLRYDGPTPVENYHEGVLEGIDALCRYALPYSSKAMLDRYSRFEIESGPFQRKPRKLESFATKFSELQILDLLDGLVGLKHLYRNQTFASSFYADSFLETASYAGCLLGGESSPGDLRLFITYIQTQVRWESEQMDPEQMFKCYREGNNRYLSFLLCELLKGSIQELTKMGFSSHGYSSFRHAPLPWFINEAGETRLHVKAVQTQYHLYSSLLDLVEATSSTALN